MYCHCLIPRVYKQADDLRYRLTPLLTVVDKEGICKHCGYYAIRAILEPEKGISQNERIFLKYNFDRLVSEKPRDLIDIWRESLGYEFTESE